MKYYDKLDDFIMAGVNAGVKAWNWTTGRTKGDLATILQLSGFALMGTGIMTESPQTNSPLLAFCISGALCSYLDNRNIDAKEMTATEKNCLDLDVEKSKSTSRKYLAPLPCLVGLHFISLSYSKNKGYFGIPLGIGMNLWGAGVYVSRADYLPPRKNVISRASDRIRELIKNKEQQPIGAPVPTYCCDTVEAQVI